MSSRTYVTLLMSRIITPLTAEMKGLWTDVIEGIKAELRIQMSMIRASKHLVGYLLEHCLHPLLYKMSLPTESKTWIIQNPPTHAVNLDTCSPGSTFVMQVLPLKEIENDEALVQPIFFSNDPGQRGSPNRPTKEKTTEK